VLGLAALVALLLWQGFEHDLYAPFLFPLAGALLVSAVGLLAIRLGHCRSTSAALVLGLAVAALVTLGPHLLAYRLLTRDGSRLDGKGARSADPIAVLDHRFATHKLSIRHPWFASERRPPGEEGDTTWFWVTTASEIVLLPLVIVLPLVLRVWRVPYCETCRLWSERRRLGFLPSAEMALRATLAREKPTHEDLAKVAAAAVLPLHPNRAALVGILDTCPGLACSGPAGYLSLKRSRGEAVATLQAEPVNPWFRLRPRCAELSRAEVAALQALLPKPTVAGGTEVVMPSWAALLGKDDAGEHATLTTIRQEHPPPAAASRARNIASALNLAIPFGGAALGFGFLGLAALVEDRSKAASGALFGTAIAVWVVVLVVTLRDPHLLGDRHLLGRLRTRLAARADRLLAGHEPDVLAVAMVPRTAWSEPSSSDLVDHGFVAVRNGAVLYEGDRLRFRAGGPSIASLRSEPLVVDQYQTWHFIVLAVRGPEGRHDLPLVRIGCPIWETLARSKRQRAAVLERRLATVLPGEAIIPGGSTR
jgi:hypothetical protein